MTKETLQSYVKFLYPGVMFSESSIKPVDSRNPLEIKAPKESYGYKFFDRQEYKAKDGEVLIGQPRNHSGMYYFGKIMTLEDVQREVPDNETLLRNMRSNSIDKVVKTRIGNFQYFKNGDVIISEG